MCTMSANRPLTLDNVEVCNTYELFLEVAGVVQLSGLKILVARKGRNGITLGYH